MTHIIQSTTSPRSPKTYIEDKTDPFAIFLQPPRDETSEQREARIARELEAKRVSDEIDAQLRAERSAKKKNPLSIHVLVHGQAESGRSTLLENIGILAAEKLDPEYSNSMKFKFIPSDTTNHSKVATPNWIFHAVGDGTTTPLNILPIYWRPYLQTVGAVVLYFYDLVVPVSCINEYLPEGNRLEDSFHRWQSICQSHLFDETIPLIVVFNKRDILKEKLESGMLAKKYITSYGERPNDVENVVKYMRRHFKHQLRVKANRGNPYYFYETSKIDSELTATVLRKIANANKQDIILSSEKTFAELGNMTPIEQPISSTGEASIEDAVLDDDFISVNSEYSLASSRTESTEYGHYARRMAPSLSTFETDLFDDEV